MLTFRDAETGVAIFCGRSSTSAMVYGSIDEMRAMLHNVLLPGFTWRLEIFNGHAYCAIQHPNCGSGVRKLRATDPCARVAGGNSRVRLIDREEEAESAMQATKELWNG